MNWPETGGRGSGHKRAAGILGLQRPRYGPSLTSAIKFVSWCRRRGSKPNYGLSSPCVNVRRSTVNTRDFALLPSVGQDGASRTKTHQNAQKV